jgi:uncharacterized damage-inducible protein DinB
MSVPSSSAAGSAGAGGAALLQRMWQHVHWADAQVLHLLSTSAAAGQPNVVRLLAHLVAAERVWLLRLRGEDSGAQAIWPEWSMEEVNAVGAANVGDFGRLLAGLSDADLAREVAYANSRGDAFRTSAGDILTHVALHGAYHRGQIAAAVRAAGGEPVNTDFINWVRQGSPLVEPPEPGRLTDTSALS